jgi:hypothetical protein
MQLRGDQNSQINCACADNRIYPLDESRRFDYSNQVFPVQNRRKQRSGSAWHTSSAASRRYSPVGLVSLPSSTCAAFGPPPPNGIPSSFANRSTSRRSTSGSAALARASANGSHRWSIMPPSGSAILTPLSPTGL